MKTNMKKKIGAGLLAVIFAFAGFAGAPLASGSIADQFYGTSQDYGSNQDYGSDQLYGTGHLFGAAPVYASAKSAGFVITDYDVDLVVHDNSVYDITETIETNFTQEKHGIYRSIPTVMNIARADGSSGKAYAKVKDFQANTDWEVDDDYSDNSSGVSQSYVVRLGDEDETVNGKQTYVLSYEYVVDGDLDANGDEFYFNIIGTGWETSINHATFHIQMPKKFDTKRMGFSIGEYGKEGHKDGEMSYKVQGKTIAGQTLRTLEEGEGLSIRIELPESYFTSTPKGKAMIPIMLLPILFALIAAILWFRFGRDDKIVETVEFEPPNGCNSLDVASIYKLDVQKEDVMSLLICLAERGYLSIEPKKKGKKSKDFIFRKLKEYDGQHPGEASLMAALFHKGHTAVATTDLADDTEYHEKIEAIVTEQNDRMTGQLVTRTGRWMLFGMAAVSTIISALTCVFYASGTIYFPLALIPGAILICAGAFLPTKNDSTVKKGIALIGFVLFCLVAGIGYGYGLYISDVLDRVIPAVGILFFIDLACILVISTFANLIQKLTPYGSEMTGKVLGFKNFLKTAEKDRIEKLIEDDPQAFYHIIPYAYVLDVSDTWIKKFEGINLEKPDWYLGSSDRIDVSTFGSMMNASLMNTMSSVSTEASSSGGGGGGGFSGGGFGGGGGGSW